MKHKENVMFFQISRLTTLLFLGLLSGVFAALRQAQASGKADLQVQMALTTNATFSLGEPIILKYKILNTSPERAETFMGKDQTEWVGETLVDAQGHTIPIKARRTGYPHGGTHSDGVSVSPMSSATGYVVFNPWTAIHTAGKYQFTVHTRLPYALGEQAEGIARNRYEAMGNVAAGDFTFSLNVTPRASRTLKQAAEALRQDVANARTQNQASAVVEALFSMPEVDVYSIWQGMISDPTTPRSVLGFAAEQLVRLHTLNAADLVAQMRWEPARPLGTDEIPIGVLELDEMSRLGDAQLKKHIESLYAAHGDAHEYSFAVAD